jgi:RNA polymerase sigma-70 factor (ECF subfamily)
VATAAIDAMRQIRSRRETPLDGSDPDGHGETVLSGRVGVGPSPERIASGREMVAVARRVLSRLPASRRRAVGLHLQGFTTQEIAALMGWSEAKARNLVYRGLAELREKVHSATSSGADLEMDGARGDEVGR